MAIATRIMIIMVLSSVVAGAIKVAATAISKILIGVHKTVTSGAIITKTRTGAATNGAVTVMNHTTTKAAATRELTGADLAVMVNNTNHSKATATITMKALASEVATAITRITATTTGLATNMLLTGVITATKTRITGRVVTATKAIGKIGTATRIMTKTAITTETLTKAITGAPTTTNAQAILTEAVT